MKIYETLTRSVPVSELGFDGSTLEAIFVPWDIPITVYDEAVPYDEGFRRTAFNQQFDKFPESIHNVALLPRHGSREPLGMTRKLDVIDAGLHGVIGVLPSRRDDVAAMVEMGMDSVSIEFNPLQKAPRAGKTRWREHALLTAVVLTSIPAYADAKVLALRDADIAARAEVERLAHMATLQAELDELKASRWAKQEA